MSRPSNADGVGFSPSTYLEEGHTRSKELMSSRWNQIQTLPCWLKQRYGS